MIRYIFKRSLFALKDRKTWFAFIFIPIFLYGFYMIWTSASYSVSSEIVFEIKDSEKRTGFKDAVIWGGLSSLPGEKRSFLLRNVRDMPQDLIENIASEFSKKDFKGWRGNKKNKNIQKAREVVLKTVSLKSDNRSYRYILTYRGDDKSLGIKVLSFYTERLMKTLMSSAENLSTPGASHLRSFDKLKVKTKIAKHAVKRVRKTVIPGIDNPEDEARFYRILTEYISGAKRSSPRVISTSKYIISNLLVSLLYVALLSICAVALISIIAEFSNRSLNTEVQVARYLDVPIIGSLPVIHSLDE